MMGVSAVAEKTMTVEGWAVVFEKPSRNFGNFVEIVDKHALDECDLSNVAFLLNHDMSKLLARNTNESLALEIREEGLFFSAKIIDTDDGRNAFKLIQDGILNKMSYGYFEDEDAQKVYRDEQYGLVRRVMKIDEIYEISAVTMPAYNDTELKAQERSRNLLKEKLNEQEKLLLEIELMELEANY